MVFGATCRVSGSLNMPATSRAWSTIRLAGLALTASLLGGCAGKYIPLASESGAPVEALAQLPTPGSEDVVRSARRAFVGPFTELSIEVFGIPDLQRDVMTNGSGELAFPLIGTVDAIGKTPGQLSEIIKQRLATRFVKNPQVTVNFKSSSNPLAYQSQAVTVDGQVQRPGLFPVVGEMTLMRAVAQAGGLTEFAREEDVVVFRSVGGKDYVGLYNIEGIRRGNYADPEVFPGDIVVVGESTARRRFRDIIAAASLITTPFIVLSNALR